MNPSSYQKFLKNFYKFIEEHNKEVREKISETITLSEDDSKKLDELFATLVCKADMCSTKAVAKKKREPTKYNLFMKEMITKLRAENPDIEKKELMSMGAREWQKLKLKEAGNESATEKTASKPAAKNGKK